MKYLVLVLMIATAAPVAARDLNLDQTLRLAEGHSGQLKASRSLYDASGGTVAGAKAERLPTLSLQARASYINDIPSLNIDIPGFFQMSREIGSKENYQTDLNLSVPLYTGGRISSGIAAAQSRSEYARASADATLSGVRLQARMDFFGLNRALQTRRAAEASRARTEIINRDVRSSLAAGAADSVDILESNLALTRAEFQVRQAEAAVRVQSVQLATHLGLPVTEPLTVNDTLPDPDGDMMTVPETVSRPEHEAAAASVGLAEAGLKSARSGWLPALSAYAGYSYGKPNNDQFNGGWNDYATVGAQLQWSLNLGMKTARSTESARYELEAARFRMQDVDETINREVEVAAENLRLAYSQYASARDQYRITKDNYRLARSQRESGALSANRLLEIEAALTEAEALALAAKVDFYVAQSSYYYATGDDKLGEGI